jgi:hypothetical protein
MRESELHPEFPVTCWNLILQAANVPSAATREALEKLCQEYWPPLYAYLRRAGHDPHEAKDLVQEYLARGKRELFEALKPSLTGGAAEDRAALGRALGMTPGAVAVAVHRLRLRLRELVRLEVAQTVESAAMIDEEMRELLAILSGSGRA